MILLADTNIDPKDIAGGVSKNTLILKQGLLASTGVGSAHDYTCYFHNQDGTEISHKYDSILSNFGSSLTSKVAKLSGQVQSAAPSDATMHLPVVATLTF